MAAYKDIEFLDIEKNILLTKEVSTGNVYVKKYISDAQKAIYEKLRQKDFAGVPKVIDIYDDNGCWVLIEEYIKGQSIQNMLDKGFPFTFDFISCMAKSLCCTLAPIHRENIVHRDISAANVICTPRLEFYLIDFGNARTYKKDQATDTEYIGTQGYAAPEQYGFGQSDRHTDIYAIGALMNVLLTGEFVPFNKRGRGGLSKIVKRCTAVNANKRYKSVSTLSMALKLNELGIISKTMNALVTISVLFFSFCAIMFAIEGAFGPMTDSSVDGSDLIIAASSPEERAYRRWSDIENCIADGNYDTAQQRLDQAVSEGLNGSNIYILYAQNYYAQQRYDDAAKSLIKYCTEIDPGLEPVDASPITEWFKLLLPDCSESVQLEIYHLMP